MKKYLIAAATLALLALGTVPANAATWEPNGEEEVVTLTVPTAANGCANLPGDISGTADIYVPYGNESVLAARYTTVEDSDGFTITATLQSQYYSLSNPLAPGRSTSATFQIPRCATAEPVITEPACQEDEPCWDCKTMGNKVCGTPEVLLPPVVAPPATVPGTLPVPAAEPIIPAPVAPVQAESVPAPVTAPVEAVQAVPVKATELAYTGAKEDRLIALTVIGSLIMLAGVGTLVFIRR